MIETIALVVSILLLVLLIVPCLDPTSFFTGFLFILNVILSSQALQYLSITYNSGIVSSVSTIMLGILPFAIVIVSGLRIVHLANPSNVVNGSSSLKIRVGFAISVLLPVVPMVLALFKQPGEVKSHGTFYTIMLILSLLVLLLFFFLSVVMPRTQYPLGIDLLFANTPIAFALAAIAQATFISLFTSSSIIYIVALAIAVVCQLAWQADLAAIFGKRMDLEGLGIGVPKASLFSLNIRLFGPPALSDKVTLQENVTWFQGERDGVDVTLTADVYLPKNPTGAVLVRPHSGGFVMFTKGMFNAPWWSAMLAARGILVVDPDYGLVKGLTKMGTMDVPEGPWSRLAVNPTVEDCCKDMLLVQDWAAAKITSGEWIEGMDHKFFYGGGSAGANLSAYMAIRHPDRIAGAFFESIYLLDEKDNTDLPISDPHFAPVVSPHQHYHVSQAPTLQIHGLIDPMADYGRCFSDFSEKMREAGVNYGSMEVPTGGHLLIVDSTASALMFLEVVLKFISKNMVQEYGTRDLI